MQHRVMMVLALLLCIVGMSYGRGPIRGFVVDALNGEPLPVANVVINGTSNGASTNLDGFFVIPSVENGDYDLDVSYLGYHSTTIQVEVTNTVMEPITIEILPSAVQLEEVVYTVEENNDDDTRASPRVSTVPVDPEVIRMMPSLGAETDVLRAIQAIPGVKASSAISSALYVRGGSPDMTLLMLDQSTVYNPSHLFGIFSTFNADAVKHLQLMKGGFPAEYGGRAGSVLEVITNDGNRREYEGLVSASIISARAAFEGPLPNNMGSFAISGRRTYFDPVIQALRNSSEDYENLPDYYFYDANAKVNLDLSQRTTLTIGTYMGRDDLEARFGDEDSKAVFRTDWGNRTYFSRLRHVLSPTTFLTASAAYSHYSSGFIFENEGILLSNFDNRFKDWAFRTDLEFHPANNHVVRTGVQLSIYNSDFSSESEDVIWVNIDTTVFNVSHYLQDNWRINTRWEVQPGVRWYFHNDGDFWRVDPRLAVVHYWDDHLRFKLAGGRYTQWVNVITSGEGFSSFDIWTPIDGSVEPTYSDQIVFGVEYDFHEDMEFTFESYYNDMNNVLEYNETIDAGTNMAEAYLMGDGYAYGFEWMLRKKAGRWTGWLGYSLSWSKRRFENTAVNNGNWYYPKWDRRHDFIAILNYRLNERWSFSSQWRYNTGQGFTRGNGIYTHEYAGISPGASPEDGRTVVPGSLNNYRLPADHQLDLTAIYHHHCFGTPAKLYISVYNAYSRRQLWNRYNDTFFNPVQVDDIKLLPILPLVGYEVRF